MTDNTPLKQDFRHAMASRAAGVHVITTDGAAGRYGITMTAVSSITDEPPTVMLCINRSAAIIPILQTNRDLCINVLSAGQQDVAEHFAGITQLARKALRIPYLASRRQWPIAGGRCAGAYARAHRGATRYRHPLSVFYVEISEIKVHDAERAPALCISAVIFTD